MKTNPFLRKYLVFLAVLALGASVATAAYSMGKRGPTLYERLGRIYGIAPLAEDLTERLYADETINSNPKVKEALERTSKAGLRYLITSFVAEAAGGPENYAGRSMREAHAGLALTDGEWDAFMAELKGSLERFKVPEEERSEVIALVEGLKDEVLNRPTPAPAPMGRPGYGY